MILIMALNDLITKNMKTIFSVFLLINISLFYVQTSFACLNGETKELKNGELIYEDQEGYTPHGHLFFVDNANEYNELVKELDKLYKKTKDVDYLSDKGYVLILQGKYKEAVKLYLELEKIKPNRYSTASNIGTAYELLGQNEKALFWIKKSVEIEPLSHNNSEWLHVNILKAKIKGEKYVNSDFLITTNFGKEVEPKTELSYEELIKLRDALFFQLNERVSFIKDKDKIVALLLFELGNVSLLLDSPYEAASIYKSAKEYGFQSQLLEKRLSLAEKKGEELQNRSQLERIQRALIKEIKNYYIEITISILFLLTITFLGVKYIRNRKSKSKF